MYEVNDMETITIGEKFNEKYSFRETCFGIVRNGNKLLVVNKNKQYSLVGGGIEEKETFKECLKREFIEESGYSVTGVKELVCIDCYWLAAGKYPMLSRANIFIVDVDLDNKKEPLESDCFVEWIDINKITDLLPLPYHKKALEYYFEFVK